MLFFKKKTKKDKKDNMENVVILNHPLIKHKISLLRDKNTGTNEFRKLVEEIAMLEGYEALSDLPIEEVEVETPIEKCMTPMIAGRKLAIVPILRAGLGYAVRVSHLYDLSYWPLLDLFLNHFRQA